MALSYLIKYIYSSVTDDNIRRGKKIFSYGNVQFIEYDELLSSVLFRIKDDVYAVYYKVRISKFNDAQKFSLRCSCPYNTTEACRHKAAALFQLQEMIDKNQLGEKEILYNQEHTVIKMKQINLKVIRMLASQATFTLAEEYLHTNKRASIIEAKNERVCAEVDYGGPFTVLIQKNDDRNFDTSCNCKGDIYHPLCVHKTIVLIQLLNAYGANYFDTIRNLDKEKNKLLSMYGYSLEGDIAGKFEFIYKEGKPFLRVLDTSIQRIEKPPAYALKRSEIVEEEDIILPTKAILQNNPAKSVKIGIVINQNVHQYPYLQLDLVQGEPNDNNDAFVGKVEKLDISKFLDTAHFSEDDKLIIQQLRKILPGEVTRYLDRNSPFSGIWGNIIQHDTDKLPDETRQLVTEYLHPRLKNIVTSYAEIPFVYNLPIHKAFQTANIEQVFFSDRFITPEVSIDYARGIYEITCHVSLPSGYFRLADNEIASSLFFKQHQYFYLWGKPEDIILVEKFTPEGKISILSKDWITQLEQFILPLTKNYIVNFNNVQKETIKGEKPEVSLWLKENGNYLLFQTTFTYRGYDVNPGDAKMLILHQEEKLLLIQRDITYEKSFVQKIENLHSHFIKSEDGFTLILRGAEVLKDNWFFLFIDAVKKLEVPVHGFEALKKFKFNPAKPTTKIYITSEEDWFDAKVEINFNGQKITVADIKKALTKKEQYVQLKDGSLGVLPEEWLKKYSLLFRLGDANEEGIRISKYHYNIIEELYDKRDETELELDLEERFNRLRSFDPNIPSQVEAPEHLLPILRPYQVSGFQWLHRFNEVKWGGILADDMGLGKTIQALSFLHHLKHSNGTLKAMVVCPTTLMYNWENEIKKFTPDLTYYIHHGGARERKMLLDTTVDVIITTYGTLRSDIKHLVEVAFDYVILDESQAIKNPSSKVAKAATLIRANNRLCLSGTPLQNNTFDIYSQMNFLNPGMLGSMEFFKQEFAYPIDKNGEKEQKEHLRKLLYPFILRRTKEQVAKDLPEKSEMILFCEMSNVQREIYDAYRNDFRDKILGLVDTVGVNRSQLTILQGLMKLRQICDSPAIINGEEKYPNVSVKLEELGREIAENISNHKALVFSQFLGMLALIKERLDQLGVEYEYFDGSTSAIDREKAIQHFQNDDKCRVFLISLKAGGVGLNLTAADYVYIVDPWWNPAVEQQAIDRTHRIGQTKNIFAYRMICKDTVEDKILKLQEKKRALAADLIPDEEGFVKTLTKEDVEYLFS